MVEELNIVLECMRKFDKRFDRVEEDSRLIREELHSNRMVVSGLIDQMNNQVDAIALFRRDLDRVNTHLEIYDKQPH